MRRCSGADSERIQKMEQAFDQVSWVMDTGLQDEKNRESIRLLEEYVSSGQWLRDYVLDEQGYWPDSLKRGVLSQDALYDLLRRNDEEKKEEGE